MFSFIEASSPSIHNVIIGSLSQFSGNWRFTLTWYKYDELLSQFDISSVWSLYADRLYLPTKFFYEAGTSAGNYNLYLGSEEHNS